MTFHRAIEVEDEDNLNPYASPEYKKTLKTPLSEEDVLGRGEAGEESRADGFVAETEEEPIIEEDWL